MTLTEKAHFERQLEGYLAYLNEWATVRNRTRFEMPDTFEHWVLDNDAEMEYERRQWAQGRYA